MKRLGRYALMLLCFVVAVVLLELIPTAITVVGGPILSIVFFGSPWP